MSQISVTAADIRAAGGLESFTRTVAGQSALGAGRILAVREGAKKARSSTAQRCRAKLPNEPTEEQEQATVMAWAARNERRYPALSLLHHIPNGGLRHKATAAKLIAQGVKSGVPDLCLPVPCRGYHGLYVEMKRRTRGKVSESQQWWLDQLKAHGYRAVVCRGADEAIAEITGYLGVRG